MTGQTADWTPASLGHLALRWGEGSTAASIAAELNSGFGGGFTCNSVIGMAHRKGLAARASPILRGPAKAPVKRVPRPRRKAVKATPPPVASAPKPTEKYLEKYSQPPRSAVPGGLTFIEASDAKGCLWAITMDKPFRFCGTARHSGSPYCTEHHRMGRATQKVPA